MRVIITGSTGMVGKGVLLECLEDSSVEQVLVINRKSLGISYPKLKEVILLDFHDFSGIDSQFIGFDACFHCMGVSSAGMKEDKFSDLTYTISKALATSLFTINPNILVCYVSGEGTDSTEKGKLMWARVKGRTENMFLNMGFKDAYAFRPGAILPERGIKSKTQLYNFAYILLKPFFPLMKRMKNITSTTNMGRAMINLYAHPQELKHLEGADINRIARIEVE